MSPREAEVVTLIASGLNNREIAQNCGLSPNSVKSYIRSAYRKMGVSTRTQAVLWLVPVSPLGVQRANRRRSTLDTG